jgi:NADH-quinone oxidoreductase subunit C
METPEQVRERLLARFPGAGVSMIPNPAPGGAPSLLLGADRARGMAEFLRDNPALRFDYCSNATGVDWLDREIVETIKTRVPSADGSGEKVIEQKTTRREPGCLEVVYHLYSMALGHGPLVVRLRTGNRSDRVTLPSLTPVWRSCEFQEREIFDLFGIVFEGHPDLRRLLMWDAFTDHPMRRDYVEPDDYEWEPTPHDEVLAKARRHQPPTGASAEEPAAAP